MELRTEADLGRTSVGRSQEGLIQASGLQSRLGKDAALRAPDGPGAHAGGETGGSV